MNFKKTIAKSLVVAMALGMVPVTNLQTAKAAAPANPKLLATGFVTGDKATHWGIAKEVKKAGKDTINLDGKEYKVTNVMEYPEGGIDAFSALKGKAGVIVLGTKEVLSKDDWAKVEIKAADKSLKVQYVAKLDKVKGLSVPAQHALGKGEYGYLVGTKVDNKATVEVNLATDAEVKLNNGSWGKIADVIGANGEAQDKKLKMATQVGSTFTFRIAPKEGAFGSNDAKVKITAQTKGPSVKYDVNKDSVNIKKGMEYQLVESGQKLTANWKPATPNAKTMTAKELSVANDKAYVLYARNAATDKKIPSKYTAITLNKRPVAMKLSKETLDTTGAAIQNANNKELGSIASAVGYDISKGAVLTNKSTFDWEYALSDVAPTKWSTLKAPKNVNKPSVAKLKYSKDKKANTFGAAGIKLYLREAGVKQTKDGIVTLAGVTFESEVKLANVAQVLSFKSATQDAGATVDNVHALDQLNLKYKIATGTAAKITVTANITNVAKPGTAPKIKLKEGSKVSVKPGKVGNNGNFEIVLDISKSAFKKEDDIKPAKFTLKFEGVEKEFTLTLSKK